MSGLLYLDSQIERVATREHAPRDGDGTAQEIAPQSPDRLRLTIAAEILQQPVPPASVFKCGPLRGNNILSLVVLSAERPSVVLRVEDYGQYLLEAWSAQELAGVQSTIRAASVVRAR